jgi:hypothetical protein
MDLPAEQSPADVEIRAVASGHPPAHRGLTAMILLFEGCAVVTTALMLRLLLGYLVKEGTAAHLTSQSARMLQYWATLLYVHAVGWAWFRWAPCARSAWLGLTGIFYLGGGFVFSLTIGAVAEWWGWPEDIHGMLWFIILPIASWMSGLAGCLLLLQSFLVARRVDNQSKKWWGSLRSTHPTAVAGNTSAPSPFPPPFVWLAGVSFLLAAVMTVAVAAWGGTVLASWYAGRAAERSTDFLGALLYAGVYLTASLALLAAALICGRRALQRGDAGLLWYAGVLAIVGGLQHPWLIGLPAVAAGVLAVRAAHRADLAGPANEGVGE